MKAVLILYPVIRIKKEKPAALTENGTAEAASGTDLTSWVKFKDGAVSFSLADSAKYRTAGAAKATPGFDVIDYGQEDYLFGSAEKDARHWNRALLDIFDKNAETLMYLFNSGQV